MVSLKFLVNNGCRYYWIFAVPRYDLGNPNPCLSLPPHTQTKYYTTTHSTTDPTPRSTTLQSAYYYYLFYFHVYINHFIIANVNLYCLSFLYFLILIIILLHFLINRYLLLYIINNNPNNFFLYCFWMKLQNNFLAKINATMFYLLLILIKKNRHVLKSYPL